MIIIIIVFMIIISDRHHQVGDVDADHGFWGRPEDMNMGRSAHTIIITTENKYKYKSICSHRPHLYMINILTQMIRPAQSIGPGNPGSDLARCSFIKQALVGFKR